MHHGPLLHGRWIGDGDNSLAGWLECMVDALDDGVRNLQLNIEKIAKCWDLGSNPGPPTQHTRA